ncbi:MAG: archaeosortase/exosortase family protein [Aquabacterium sp.]|nr:archaeosortase/exosortase family protein [Aquabacterium sp.]
MQKSSEGSGPELPSRWVQALRLAGFVIVFFTLHQGYGMAGGTAVERWVIEQATVQAGVDILNLVWPSLEVQAVGPRLVSAEVRLNVLNGCEGTDVLFLLLAGIAVAPVGLRRRLVGLAIGLPLVFALNQARLIALFHALRHDTALFGLLHGTVAPLLLVAAVGLFFAWWLGRAPVQARATP